jgi:hypothetical protein
MEDKEIPRYEGSHVYILDSLKNPSRVVLATNPHIGHVTTPGFGKRGDMSFENAAKECTEIQTGLAVDDLQLLSEWDNDGKPFREPNGVVQFVKVRNYLARKVGPEDIGQRIEEYRKTPNGRKYNPQFAEISTLPGMDGIASDLLGCIEENLGYRFGVLE